MYVSVQIRPEPFEVDFSSNFRLSSGISYIYINSITWFANIDGHANFERKGYFQRFWTNLNENVNKFGPALSTVLGRHTDGSEAI